MVWALVTATLCGQIPAPGIVTSHPAWFGPKSLFVFVPDAGSPTPYSWEAVVYRSDAGVSSGIVCTDDRYFNRFFFDPCGAFAAVAVENEPYLMRMRFHTDAGSSALSPPVGPLRWDSIAPTGASSVTVSPLSPTGRVVLFPLGGADLGSGTSSAAIELQHGNGPRYNSAISYPPPSAAGIPVLLGPGSWTLRLNFYDAVGNFSSDHLVPMAVGAASVPPPVSPGWLTRYSGVDFARYRTGAAPWATDVMLQLSGDDGGTWWATRGVHSAGPDFYTGLLTANVWLTGRICQFTDAGEVSDWAPLPDAVMWDTLAPPEPSPTAIRVGASALVSWLPVTDPQGANLTFEVVASRGGVPISTSDAGSSLMLSVPVDRAAWQFEVRSIDEAGNRSGPGMASVAATDAGEFDAGVVDAGTPDAGSNDAGALDSGSGPTDAGSTDAGSTDAGSDSGSLDAGDNRPEAQLMELSVACGCDAAGAVLPWAVALLGLGMRRRRGAAAEPSSTVRSPASQW